jgi:hypothetical protein
VIVAGFSMPADVASAPSNALGDRAKQTLLFLRRQLRPNQQKMLQHTPLESVVRVDTSLDALANLVIGGLGRFEHSCQLPPMLRKLMTQDGQVVEEGRIQFFDPRLALRVELQASSQGMARAPPPGRFDFVFPRPRTDGPDQPAKERHERQQEDR